MCCPRDDPVLFPDEWEEYKNTHKDAQLRRHEALVLRQSDFYEYYTGDYEDVEYEYEYEYDDTLKFQSCDAPNECVSTENCKGN